MTHYIPENNVYVYFRYTDKKTVMVVINNNPTQQTFKTAVVFKKHKKRLEKIGK
jgi:L-rhamnose mutarotase